MSTGLFNEGVWTPVERTSSRRGENAAEVPLELPANVTITLIRIQDSDYFQMAIDGELSPDALHRSTDFIKAANHFVHTERVRKEIDNGIV
jgi:hypothetical protein